MLKKIFYTIFIFLFIQVHFLYAQTQCVYFENKTALQGDQSEEIKNIQTFLNKNLSINLPITGFFGPLTKQAVIDFQEKYSADILRPIDALIGTGIWGLNSINKANTLVCNSATSNTDIVNPVNTSTQTNFSFTGIFKLGDQSEEIKNIQTFLNKNLSINLPITGFFGPLTKQAVIDFQNKNKEYVLTPAGLNSGTGIWGPLTARFADQVNSISLTVQDNNLQTKPVQRTVKRPPRKNEPVNPEIIIIAPTNLSIINQSEDSFLISWNDNSNNEEGFEIYRSEDGVNFDLIENLPANTTSYMDENLAEGTYYYKVIAYLSSTDSTPLISTTESFIVVIPSNITATLSGFNDIEVTWVNNSLIQDGLILSRSADGISYSDIATLSSTSTTYSDIDLDLGTYYYKIRATKESFETEDVGPTDALTTTINNPTGLTLDNSIGFQVTLNWTDNSTDEAEFEIYRSTDNTNFSLVGTVATNTTSYVDSGVTSGEHYYRVVAKNGIYSSDTDVSATSTFVHDPDALAYALVSGATDTQTLSNYATRAKALVLSTGQTAWQSGAIWPTMPGLNKGSGKVIYGFGGHSNASINLENPSVVGESWTVGGFQITNTANTFSGNRSVGASISSAADSWIGFYSNVHANYLSGRTIGRVLGDLVFAQAASQPNTHLTKGGVGASGYFERDHYVGLPSLFSTRNIAGTPRLYTLGADSTVTGATGYTTANRLLNLGPVEGFVPPQKTTYPLAFSYDTSNVADIDAIKEILFETVMQDVRRKVLLVSGQSNANGNLSAALADRLVAEGYDDEYFVLHQNYDGQFISAWVGQPSNYARQTAYNDTFKRTDGTSVRELAETGWWGGVPVGDLAGVFLFQGEANMGHFAAPPNGNYDQSALDHEPGVRQLIQWVRDDVNKPDLPFVLFKPWVRTTTNPNATLARQQVVNAGIENIAATVPNTAFVNTNANHDDTTTVDPLRSDGVHLGPIANFAPYATAAWNEMKTLLGI
jgi:peptidoglycan hydrolase-like protein with peptidoglycan-binding domain